MMADHDLVELRFYAGPQGSIDDLVLDIAPEILPESVEPEVGSEDDGNDDGPKDYADPGKTHRDRHLPHVDLPDPKDLLNRKKRPRPNGHGGPGNGKGKPKEKDNGKGDGDEPDKGKPEPDDKTNIDKLVITAYVAFEIDHDLYKGRSDFAGLEAYLRLGKKTYQGSPLSRMQALRNDFKINHYVMRFELEQGTYTVVAKSLTYHLEPDGKLVIPDKEGDITQVYKLTPIGKDDKVEGEPGKEDDDDWLKDPEPEYGSLSLRALDDKGEPAGGLEVAIIGEDEFGEKTDSTITLDHEGAYTSKKFLTGGYTLILPKDLSLTAPGKTPVKEMYFFVDTDETTELSITVNRMSSLRVAVKEEGGYIYAVRARTKGGHSLEFTPNETVQLDPGDYNIAIAVLPGDSEQCIYELQYTFTIFPGINTMKPNIGNPILGWGFAMQNEEGAKIHGFIGETEDNIEKRLKSHAWTNPSDGNRYPMRFDPDGTVYLMIYGDDKAFPIGALAIGDILDLPSDPDDPDANDYDEQKIRYSNMLVKPDSFGAEIDTIPEHELYGLLTGTNSTIDLKSIGMIEHSELLLEFIQGDLAGIYAPLQTGQGLRYIEFDPYRGPGLSQSNRCGQRGCLRMHAPNGNQRHAVWR